MRKLIAALSLDYLLLFIIFLSIIVRFIYLDYPLVNGESHRDYLVGRHILRFGEFPLTGPCCLWNGAFGEIRNSPTYYYFIALILFLKDDVVFLNLVNIFLQVSTIVVVYLLGKNLFGKSTGLLGTALFSASFTVFRQSFFFWQPHTMLPFINLSYLFLLLFFLKDRLLFLTLSIFFFIFAAVLHNPPYGIAPTFLFLVFYMLFKKRKTKTFWFFLLCVAVFTLALFYTPLIVHNATTNGSAFIVDGAFFRRLLTTSIADFWQRVVLALSILLENFFFLSDRRTYLLSALLVFLLGILAIFYTTKERVGERKKYFFVLVFAIAQFLIVASTVRYTLWHYYLTPLFSLFTIAVAEVVNQVLSKNAFLKLVKLVVVILLIETFSLHFRMLQVKPFMQNYHQVNLAVKAIEQELGSIKRKERKENINFFRIKVYATGVESPVTADLVFWSLLEKKLNSRFLKVVDAGNSYEFLNDDRYIFVICQSHLSRIHLDRECLNPFLFENKTHVLLRNIYSQEPFTIYLTKRQ